MNEKQKTKLLESIIEVYLESPSSELEELTLLEEFIYLYVDHQYNLNIDCCSFQDYVIKSDTLNYVHDFLSSLHPKYAEEFDEALESGKIVFVQNKRKKRLEAKHDYEVIATHHLKDSFDLIHNFFQYRLRKHMDLSKKSDYLVDTLSILAEFLFQDYLESLGRKNAEPYYPKMNRFIYTNIFTVHMMVEMKLIEYYLKNKTLSLEAPIEQLKVKNILNKELLSKNCQIIIDDILSMNGISLPFHKRYLYGIIFACFIHQKILKQPKRIQSFCYLIDHPENIHILSFMNAIGISLEEKEGYLVVSKEGYQKLKESYLTELEDCMIRVNVDYRRK